MKLNNLVKNQQIMFLLSVLLVGFFALWVLGDLSADKSPRTQRAKKPTSKTDSKNMICWFLTRLFNFIFY